MKKKENKQKKERLLYNKTLDDISTSRVREVSEAKKGLEDALAEEKHKEAI